ncbi:radical SAM protein, partial [uncultured Treponema sp.]|uniref:radical SAM protein n=1 Tax=uncultured Treponema sp. TaxID=162155 RepID=UPI00259977E7
SFFASLSEKTFVSIELGFQTSNELSAAYIRRAYTDDVYDDAVRRIKKASAKIHVVTHIIFGLPGETERDMLETVRYCVRAGTDGLKISLLHVLAGTPLETDYYAGKFKTMEMQEYFTVLGKALQIIPSGIVMHRLTGDGAKKLLISPIWTASKKSVYNKMTSYLRENHIVQGEKTCEVSSAL